jgi:hypothetical protein
MHVGRADVEFVRQLAFILYDATHGFAGLDFDVGGLEEHFAENHLDGAVGGSGLAGFANVLVAGVGQQRRG